MQLGDFIPLQGSSDLRLQNIAILRPVRGQQMMILAYSYTQYVKKKHHRS